MKKIGLGALAMAALLTLGMTANVMAESTRERGGNTRASAEERRAQFHERRMARLAEKLEIDEATAAKLSEIMKSQMESRQAAIKTLQNEIKALKAIVDRKAPEAEIAAQLQKITAARQAMHDNQMKGYAEIQALLGAEKSARLLLQQQSQAKEMREQVRSGMRGQNGQRGQNGSRNNNRRDNR